MTARAGREGAASSRPITDDLAVRLWSASCESPERPGWMVCRELSRTLIPISQSNLNGDAEETRP